MDCYDYILEIYNKEDRLLRCLNYLINLMQTEGREKTSLEFNNCLILILAILNDDIKDFYCTKIKNAFELQGYRKEKMVEILRSEFA